MSRLTTLLTEKEQRAFEEPPVLTAESRAICFALTPEVDLVIQRLRTPTNQVGFLLQYGYFKACGRFFIPHKMCAEDIDYVCHLLEIDSTEVNFEVYKERIPILHQQKILDLLHYKPFNKYAYEMLKKEVARLCIQQREPKAAFAQILAILKQQKITCPSYHRLAELITQVYALEEQKLLLQIETLLAAEQKQLGYSNICGVICH